MLFRSIKLQKLADTYTHMSKNGFNEFNSGDIAKELSKTIREGGGIGLVN